MSAIEGVVQLVANGRPLNIKGRWQYNLGRRRGESIMGANGQRQGLREIPQVAFLEGAVTDDSDTRVKDLLGLRGATITLMKLNGKQVVFRNADQVGEGTVETEEGEIALRFEANDAEEL
jgi:hypothetical protein